MPETTTRSGRNPARQARRACLAGALALTAIPLTALPSHADPATFAFDAGVFTIIGTPGNDPGLHVTCSGGTVQLSGTIDTGVACTAVTELRINGMAGNDTMNVQGTLTALPNATSIMATGGPGTDQFLSSPLPDTFDGGGATDIVQILDMASLKDSWAGGAGHDILIQSGDVDMTLSDKKVSGYGKDTLSGFEQAVLTGGPSANTIDASGWSGMASLQGGAGDDTLLDGPGRAQLTGGDGDDALFGGPGDDNLIPDQSVSGDDTLRGGPGSDSAQMTSASGGSLSDSQALGQGTDSLGSIESMSVNPAGPGPYTFDASAFSGDAFFGGTSQADTLTGGSGDDAFSPGSGNDIVTGNGGTNLIAFNATGDTTVTDSSAVSSAGTDTLSGIQRVSVAGSNAAQVFTGSSFTGSLLYRTNGGSDTVHGNGANTRVSAFFNADVVATNSDVTDLSTTVTLDGVGSLELLVNNIGGVSVDARAFSGPVTAWGTPGNDTILTGSRADLLLAGAGDDVLRSGRGNDRLYGQGDADRLNAGKGTDRCDTTAEDTARSCEKRAPAMALN